MGEPSTQEILLTIVGDRPGEPAPRIAIVVDGALLATEPPLAGLQRRGWLAHRWEQGMLLEYLAPELWEELQALGETARQVAAAIAPWQRESPLVSWDGEDGFGGAEVAGGPYLERVQTWAQTLKPPAIVVVVLHRAPPDLPLVLAKRPRPFWRRPQLSWMLLSPDRDLGDRLRAIGWQTFTKGAALQKHLEQRAPAGIAVPIVDACGREVARWDGGVPARLRFAVPATSPWFELVWRPPRWRWGILGAAIVGLGLGWLGGRTWWVPAAESEIVPVATSPRFTQFALTVYFPQDSTLLTPLQRQRLRDFWAAHQGQTGDLQVVGHADNGETYRDSLAEQRAWAVVAFLRQNLSDRQRLIVGHRGARQSLRPDPSFNRRVELTFVRRTSQEPSHRIR